VENSPDYSDWKLHFSAQEALVHGVLGSIQRTPGVPRIYERHVYHIDFTRFQLQNVSASDAVAYAYINVLRDPATRMQSSYYFFQDECACSEHPPPWCAGLPLRSGCVRDINKLETSLQASLLLRKDFNGCELCQWFCGHDPRCDPSIAALRLRENYATVLLLEELPLSLRILARRLPHYFGPPLDIELLARTHLRPVEDGQPTKHPPATNATLARMREVLKQDYLLYNFARERLMFQARACGFTTGSRYPRTREVQKIVHEVGSDRG